MIFDEIKFVTSPYSPSESPGLSCDPSEALVRQANGYRWIEYGAAVGNTILRGMFCLADGDDSLAIVETVTDVFDEGSHSVRDMIVPYMDGVVAIGGGQGRLIYQSCDDKRESVDTVLAMTTASLEGADMDVISGEYGLHITGSAWEGLMELLGAASAAAD